jgi:hypothetical protein
MGKKKKQGKLPYLQLYPADWQSERSLNFCSWEARYVWFEMLLLMHQSPRRGYLLHQSGTPYTEADLVEVIHKATLQRIKDCLFELETNHVYSRNRDGVIYSRKMVKGERKKLTAQTNGKGGGNPALKTPSPESAAAIPQPKRDQKAPEKGEITHQTTHGKQKETSASDNQTLVYQSLETRDQRLESKKKDTYALSGGAPEIQMAFSMFNAMALKAGLPAAQKLTESRKAKMRQRLKDCGGLEGFRAALEKVAGSSFLTGGGDRGWKIDIDSLLQEKTFTRVMEGNYDNQKGKHNGKSIGEQAKNILDGLGKG